jgi:hypothetical protein
MTDLEIHAIELAKIVRKEHDFYSDETAEIVEYLKTMKARIKKRYLKLNTGDPYNFVLTNQRGDTFTFNPNSKFGEELNDFLYGYFSNTNQ